jgi:hypothetical protein
MKKLMLILTLMLAFVSVSMAQDPGWPRQKTSSAGRLVYYQPQVDSWNNYRDVQFRMAFSLTPTGGKQVVGVVQIKSSTDINMDARTSRRLMRPRLSKWISWCEHSCRQILPS